MVRVASAGDNAAMESFSSLLQKHVLNRQPRPECDQLRSAIITWVELTYNHCRRQRAFGKIALAELEAVIGWNIVAAAGCGQTACLIGILTPHCLLWEQKAAFGTS